MSCYEKIYEWRCLGTDMKKRMSASFIKEKIRDILAERLSFDVAEIKESFRLKEDLGIDSFDSLRIIFQVEDEFNITVPRAEVINIKTVKDICSYIKKRVA